MKKDQLKFLVKSIIREMNENSEFEKILKKAGVDPKHYQQNIPKLPGWKEEEPTIKKKPSRPIHQQNFDATKLGPLEAHSMGYSHNVELPDPQGGDRDPLNDPLLAGKPFEKETVDVEATDKFKFIDFNYLKRGDGFGVPSDVKYGSTYIGTIESTPKGYVIKMIDSPQGKKPVEESPKNNFKSKNQAAEVLHRTWQYLRTKGKV